MTLRPPTTLSPSTHPQHTLAVTESTLPLSGLKVVLAERGPRQTLQIDDEHGQLVSVISDSLLDPTVLRGAWRGVRGAKPWAVVVGRSISAPVSVTFSSRRLRLRGHKTSSIVLEPVWIGDFWLAEASTDATHATITAAGALAGSSTLDRLA